MVGNKTIDMSPPTGEWMNLLSASKTLMQVNISNSKMNTMTEIVDKKYFSSFSADLSRSNSARWNDSPCLCLCQLWCDFDKSNTFRNQTYNESASIPDICFYPEVPTRWAVGSAVRSVCCAFSPLRQRWNKHGGQPLASQGGLASDAAADGAVRASRGKQPSCCFALTVCSWLMEPITRLVLQPQARLTHVVACIHHKLISSWGSAGPTCSVHTLGLFLAADK